MMATVHRNGCRSAHQIVRMMITIVIVIIAQMYGIVVIGLHGIVEMHGLMMLLMMAVIGRRLLMMLILIVQPLL